MGAVHPEALQFAAGHVGAPSRAVPAADHHPGAAVGWGRKNRGSLRALVVHFVFNCSRLLGGGA
jgi:hypothetical protein